MKTENEPTKLNERKIMRKKATENSETDSQSIKEIIELIMKNENN